MFLSKLDPNKPSKISPGSTLSLNYQEVLSMATHFFKVRWQYPIDAMIN